MKPLGYTVKKKIIINKKKVNIKFILFYEFTAIINGYSYTE